MQTQLTDRQKLADFSTDYGLPKIALRAHEELINYGVREGTAIVVITRYRTQETRTRIRFVARGTLMRTWSRNQHGGWFENPPVMMWEGGFQPRDVSKYIEPTAQERRESEVWAMDCHRPGASRSPMDNFDRTAADLGQSAPRMGKHWGLA